MTEQKTFIQAIEIMFPGRPSAWYGEVEANAKERLWPVAEFMVGRPFRVAGTSGTASVRVPWLESALNEAVRAMVSDGVISEAPKCVAMFYVQDRRAIIEWFTPTEDAERIMNDRRN